MSETQPSLSVVEKRNRAAADLAGLTRQINQTAQQVQTTAQGILAGLDALAQQIDGDEDFSAGDLADIDAARQQLATTIDQVAQALASQINPE